MPFRAHGARSHTHGLNGTSSDMASESESLGLLLGVPFARIVTLGLFLNLFTPLFPQLSNGIIIVPISWCSYEDKSQRVNIRPSSELLVLSRNSVTPS